MVKLSSKSEVIERYWPDFLNFCMTGFAQYSAESWLDKSCDKRRATPTLDNFWLWYITDGPMGVKNRCQFYTKESIQYV